MATGGNMAGLLGLEEISNDPGRMGLLMMGLGMMGGGGGRNATFGDSMQGGMQGLLAGMQQAQAMKMQNRRLSRDEQEQAWIDQQREAMQGMDINNPDAVNQLLRSGNAAQAMQLLKIQQPNKGIDPYYQAIPTSDGYISFNARTGEYAPLGSNGQPLRQPAADPGLQGQIMAAKENQKINDVTLQDGRKVPRRMGDVVGTTERVIDDEYLKALMQAASQNDDPQLKDRAAAELDAISRQQGNNPEIGQSTAEEAKQKELGKASGEAASSVNNRLTALDGIIEEADRGIQALSPKVDPLSGNVVGFGIETGGMLPSARKLWSSGITNDPNYRDIETAASGAKLQGAINFLKGQGSVTEAERALIGEQTGIDPYQYSSQRNFERLVRLKKNAENAKKAILQQSQGNFSPVQSNQGPSVDDLLKLYGGQ